MASDEAALSEPDSLDRGGTPGLAAVALAVTASGYTLAAAVAIHRGQGAEGQQQTLRRIPTVAHHADDDVICSSVRFRIAHAVDRLKLRNVAELGVRFSTIGLGRWLAGLKVIR